MRTFELTALLAPLTTSQFFSDYFGQRFVHVKGDTSKFGSLLSWQSLNTVLRIRRVDSKHLRLVKEGVTIPQQQYTNRSIAADRLSVMRYSATKIKALLREGATLIVNGMDEMHEPIAALAEELERQLQTSVGVNLYAAWKQSRGFDLHWDDHDVLILQIEGTKRWRLYGQTTKYPLTHEMDIPQPTGQPVWAEYLYPGDLLYIPRGCWHVAEPLNEPTVHLTVGLYNPTALTLLQWLTDGLKAHDCIRRDIPRFAPPHVMDAYLQELRRVLLSAIMDPKLVDSFYRCRNITIPSRPHFGLPWSATDAPLSDTHNMIVKLAVRHLDIESLTQGETAEVSFEGKTVSLGKRHILLLKYIEQNNPCQLSQLCISCGFPIGDLHLLRLVEELVHHGAVTIQQTSPE